MSAVRLTGSVANLPLLSTVRGTTGGEGCARMQSRKLTQSFRSHLVQGQLSLQVSLSHICADCSGRIVSSCFSSSGYCTPVFSDERLIRSPGATQALLPLRYAHRPHSSSSAQAGKASQDRPATTAAGRQAHRYQHSLPGEQNDNATDVVAPVTQHADAAVTSTPASRLYPPWSSLSAAGRG